MKVIYTSALIPNKFEERKLHYKNSYSVLLEYFNNSDIYIVECFSDKSDFLSDFGCQVYLTNTHDVNIRNKGVLEMKGISDFILNNKIEDDYFLKVTGRYKFLDNYFIKNYKDNIGHDFYGKLIDNKTQVFTGCFIIKNKILNEFIEYVDLNHLESNMINIEMSLLNFLIENNKNCFFIDKLNIEAPIFGQGDIKKYLI
jgi:hypothetical protein